MQPKMKETKVSCDSHLYSGPQVIYKLRALWGLSKIIWAKFTWVQTAYSHRSKITRIQASTEQVMLRNIILILGKGMVAWSKATLITTPWRGTKARPKAVYAMEEQDHLFRWTLLTSSEFSSHSFIRGLCSNPRSTLMLASGSAWLGVERRHEPKSCMDNADLYFNHRKYS